jgi:hypothetical protein
MTIAALSSAIDTITNSVLNGVYMRATDDQANTDLDNVDLRNKTVVLFNNLPDMDFSVTRGGYTSQTIPVEIRVLQLAEIDDNETQSDVIRDNCVAIANMVFDKLTVYQITDDVIPYRINLLGETKVYDKTMTGCKLVFDLVTERTVYSCP